MEEVFKNTEQSAIVQWEVINWCKIKFKIQNVRQYNDETIDPKEMLNIKSQFKKIKLNTGKCVWYLTNRTVISQLSNKTMWLRIKRCNAQYFGIVIIESAPTSE